MIRRVRAWAARGTVTTPPRALLLILLGFLAIAVAWAVIEFLAGIVLLVKVLITEDESNELGVLLAVVLQGALTALGWYVLKQLIALWVRAQPPDPPRPLDR